MGESDNSEILAALLSDRILIPAYSRIIDYKRQLTSAQCELEDAISRISKGKFICRGTRSLYYNIRVFTLVLTQISDLISKREKQGHVDRVLDIKKQLGALNARLEHVFICTAFHNSHLGDGDRSSQDRPTD